jgi:hypothetical protein
MSSNKTRGRPITGNCQGALGRLFRHDHALVCIERDYVGDTQLLGVEFKLMFRLSRGRFQVLMEDVTASNIGFFKSTVRDGFDRSSLAARLLLPLAELWKQDEKLTTYCSTYKYYIHVPFSKQTVFSLQEVLFHAIFKMLRKF